MMMIMIMESSAVQQHVQLSLEARTYVHAHELLEIGMCCPGGLKFWSARKFGAGQKITRK